MRMLVEPVEELEELELVVEVVLEPEDDFLPVLRALQGFVALLEAELYLRQGGPSAFGDEGDALFGKLLERMAASGEARAAALAIGEPEQGALAANTDGITAFGVFFLPVGPIDVFAKGGLISFDNSVEIDGLVVPPAAVGVKRAADPGFQRAVDERLDDLRAAQERARVGLAAGRLEVGDQALVAGVALVAVLMLAYYAGGYVAGRMSRFDGGKQGAGVWVTGLLLTALALGAGLVFGTQYNVLDRVDLPSLPIPAEMLGLGGIITAVVALVGSLLAAIGGGKVGCRYHRKVDDYGYEG